MPGESQPIPSTSPFAQADKATIVHVATDRETGRKVRGTANAALLGVQLEVPHVPGRDRIRQTGMDTSKSFSGKISEIINNSSKHKGRVMLQDVPLSDRKTDLELAIIARDFKGIKRHRKAPYVFMERGAF